MRGYILAGLAAALASCSTQGLAPRQIASAQDTLDRAIQLLEDNDAAAALPLLSQSIEDPGLDADQAARALLYRSVCHSLAGDVANAEADIAEAEPGAPAEALLLFAKAHLAKAGGKSSEATRLFRSARRLDSSLASPGT